MAHYLLVYELASDYLERRPQFRAEHLRLAWQAADAGLLLLGGALQDPADQALLLFQVDDPAIIRGFVEADPYVRHGLVARWRIRAWNTVAGSQATNPVRL